MIDLDIEIRKLLLRGTNTPLRQLVTTLPDEERVYAGDDLPEGYSPDPDLEREDPAHERGPAVRFLARGGAALRGPLLFPLIQTWSYGVRPEIARAVDRALFDTIQNAQSGAVKRIWLLTPGQFDREPPPRRWPFVQATYRAITRA